METIAVIFGGVSAEHDISIITAINSIIKPLELSGKYKVEPIYITKQGKWYADPKLKDITLYSSGNIDSFLSKQKPISLELGSGLHIVKGSSFGSKKVKIDIVFPSMHGTYGEDGSLMGALDMAGIPYVGCSMSASVIAMDKLLSKQIAESGNFPTPKYVTATKSEAETDIKKVVELVKKNLSYPVFVKPTHLGSSIAISRANSDLELINAIEVAANFDSHVLIEEEVKNLCEVTLPIIGNNELTPALLEHPLLPSEDGFLDFDSKYIGGSKGAKAGGQKGSMANRQIPAKLDKDLYAKAEKLGTDIYRFFNLSGIARVDMLIDLKTKIVYFNEINPLPGTLYIHNWVKAGINNVELVERLVALAKERFANQQKIQTTFDTNFLKQF